MTAVDSLLEQVLLTILIAFAHCYIKSDGCKAIVTKKRPNAQNFGRMSFRAFFHPGALRTCVYRAYWLIWRWRCEQIPNISFSLLVRYSVIADSRLSRWSYRPQFTFIAYSSTRLDRVLEGKKARFAQPYY